MLKRILNRLLLDWTSDKPSIPIQLARLTLLPLSLVYSSIQQTRIALYRWGLLSKQRLGAKVVSIGNLSMGGSGKTPTAALIAEILQKKGRRPVILSKGYGGKKNTEAPLVATDGEKILAGQELAGDEPYLLAKTLKNVPIIVGGDRVASGKAALDRFPCDVIILDDGFQHLRLERDLNLCLIDCRARNIFEDFVFPSGLLREPVSQLKRADVFLLTHWEETPRNQKLLKRLEEKYLKTVFRSTHAPVAWFDTGSGKELHLREIQGRKVLAFCGIANPASFLDSLRALKIEPVSFLPFPDHYQYSPQDLLSIKSERERQGADLLVATEKDWVKLEGRLDSPAPLWTLRIKIQVLEEERFHSLFDFTE